MVLRRKRLCRFSGRACAGSRQLTNHQKDLANKKMGDNNDDDGGKLLNLPQLSWQCSVVRRPISWSWRRARTFLNWCGYDKRECFQKKADYEEVDVDRAEGGEASTEVDPDE